MLVLLLELVLQTLGMMSLYDIDGSKINSLKKEKSHFMNLAWGILLRELYPQAICPRLIANSKFADVIFICVGTPQLKSGKPNLSHLLSYLNDLLNALINDKSFISNTSLKKHLFIKSTIPLER